jgi:hypothetical protein
MEVSAVATQSADTTIADLQAQLELSRAEVLNLRHQAAAFSSAPPLPRHVPVTLTGTSRFPLPSRAPFTFAPFVAFTREHFFTCRVGCVGASFQFFRAH